MAFGYFDSGEQGQQFVTNSEFAASSPTQIFNQSTTAGSATTGGASFPLTTTTITSNSPPPDHLIAQKLTQENTTRIQSAAAAFIVRRELGLPESPVRAAMPSLQTDLVPDQPV